MTDREKIVVDYQSPYRLNEPRQKLASNCQVRMLSCAILTAGCLVAGSISQHDGTPFVIGAISFIVFLIEFIRSCLY